MRLAIIGSAAGSEDLPLITSGLYDAMYHHVCADIDRWKIDTAVSGGAAFADHMAVRAFLEERVARLVLFLPAYFENGAFVPNPRVRFNPGATANKRHEGIKKAIGVDGLAEISQAISKGADVHVFEGFHTRNIEVANACDYLTAFTFGTKSLDSIAPGDPEFQKGKLAGLKDGGTMHTYGEAWNVYLKSHRSLFDIKRQLA